MPGSLSLFSEVNRHLPFVVVPVLGHTHTFGVNTFRKLILLVCGFQMQTFPEVLLNKLSTIVEKIDCPPKNSFGSL